MDDVERDALAEADRALIEAARDALDTAYAPYSEHPVGAAIETAVGGVHTGCNVENANYSNSLHAEEVALAGAARAGEYELVRIAVTSADCDGLTPCGACRQSLREFADEACRVVCDRGPEGARVYTLGELLPDTITRERLD